MGHAVRFFGLSVLVAGGLLGLALSHPQGLERVGVELATFARDEEPISEPEELVPDPGCAAALARSQARRQVIAQLIEGELTLPEAAACFRELNANTNNRGLYLFEGDTEEEKLCRMVIVWAKNEKEANGPKGEVDALVTRLAHELDARLCSSGRSGLSQHH